MFIDKYKYPFLSRMRRPEGLAPKVEQNFKRRLGASPLIVLELSFAVSVFLAIIVFRYAPSPGETERIFTPPQELVKIEDVEITRQLDRPPPPARPPIVIEAPSDESLDDVPIMSSDLNVAENVAPPPATKEEDFAQDEFFVAVEEMPEIIGGIESVLSKLVYPELAIRAGVQGRVYIIAYINEKGDVVKAEVMKGIGAGCDEAALTAVKQAKFIPGRQRGKPMKTRVSIPIRFDLTRVRM